MDYKKLNEMLSDLRKLRNGKPIEKTVIKDLSTSGDGMQGEENEIYEVYPIKGTDLFIKLKIASDSYGDNEFVDGITIVKPTQKTVTNYEPIN